ncbi:carbohydrate porin [Algimonas porphyrae]|uniref:carbohydrate porin n=1 Tax=Algimonas porphyrae TaxID=1128113 RepID=UPI00352A2EE0
MLKPTLLTTGLLWSLLAPQTCLANENGFLSYTADLLANVDGGIETGYRYVDLFHGGYAVELSPALLLHASAIYANGGNFTTDLVGDDQTIGNIESGTPLARLYEAWAEIGSEKVSLKIGLYDVGSEFDALEFSSLFLNGTYGTGFDLVQAGRTGPSIYPFLSFGARAAFRHDGTALRVAVLDGAAGDPDDSDDFGVDLNAEDGMFIIGEIERYADNWRVFAGAWSFTGDFEKIAQTPQAPPDFGSNSGFYVRGEYSWTLRDGRSLSTFARVGLADRQVNVYETFLSTGMVLDAPFSHHRPNDQMGLAVARAGLGEPERAARAIATGFNGLASSATAETNIELTYAFALSDNFVLQPDIQYTIDPGATDNIDNALVFGFRIGADFPF